MPRQHGFVALHVDPHHEPNIAPATLMRFPLWRIARTSARDHVGGSRRSTSDATRPADPRLPKPLPRGSLLTPSARIPGDRSEEIIMQTNKATGRLPAERDIRAWRSGDGGMLEWVQALSEPLCANGTFLLRTTLGSHRVHPGQVVVDQGDTVFACDAQDVAEQVRAAREGIAISRSPRVLVGPGKIMRTATPRPGRRIPAPAQRRSYAPQLGTPPSIEWVAINDLKIDMSYQRSIEAETSQRLIASIVARWDWRLCMPLAVSRREEGRFVIDGQHRHAAARLRGDIAHLPCCIATYDGRLTRRQCSWRRTGLVARLTGWTTSTPRSSPVTRTRAKCATSSSAQV